VLALLYVLSLGLSYTVLVNSLLNETNQNGNMKDLEVIYRKEGGKKKTLEAKGS
jgi:hypothetical protein